MVTPGPVAHESEPESTNVHRVSHRALQSPNPEASESTDCHRPASRSPHDKKDGSRISGSHRKSARRACREDALPLRKIQRDLRQAMGEQADRVCLTLQNDL